MNTQPDNPPAFPNTCPWPPTTAPEAFPHYGMTLRDWFAGQIAAEAFKFSVSPKEVAQTAARCYQQADAMLRAREANP